MSAEPRVDFTLSDEGCLTIRGTLTRSTIPSIWSDWQQRVLKQRVDCADMAEVDVIDTAGVALLLEVLKAHRMSSLTCKGANQQLKQIAAVSGVEGLLSLS